MRARRFGIIVQARMASTRYPGKVLLPFDGRIPILQIIVSRLLTSLSEQQIVVATSVAPTDDPLVEFCKNLNVDVFRGDEQNVLQRFISAAQEHELDVIVRVCADNPFLNSSYLGDLISFSRAHPEFDYVSYCDYSGTPSIRTHWGIFAETVTVNALLKVRELATEPLYTEHVTNYVYSNPGKFNVKLLVPDSKIFSRKDLRFTIDTKEDFRLIQQLYGDCKEGMIEDNLEAVIDHVDANPFYLTGMRKQIALFSK